jgi:hypothetical protein
MNIIWRCNVTENSGGWSDNNEARRRAMRQYHQQTCLAAMSLLTMNMEVEGFFYYLVRTKPPSRVEVRSRKHLAKALAPLCPTFRLFLFGSWARCLGHLAGARNQTPKEQPSHFGCLHPIVITFHPPSTPILPPKRFWQSCHLAICASSPSACPSLLIKHSLLAFLQSLINLFGLDIVQQNRP